VLLSDEEGLGGVEESTTKRPLIGMERVLDELQC